MKVEIELGKLNTAALKELVKIIRKMNKDNLVTESIILKKACINYIDSEYYKMLQNEE